MGTETAGRTVHSAAFFDLDNTLVQGASLFHLARGLTAHGMVSKREIAGHALRQVRFRVFGEQSGLLDDVQEHALDFVKGHEVARMEKICEAVFDDYLSDKIWPGTRALSEAHLLNGKEVWLVTAAPIELAQVIARRLGLTGALGTRPESVDGRYTGRIAGALLHGPDKAHEVSRLARERGLDLAHSYAYSDSANDLPLLSLVGHPVAVNPDRALRRHARQYDWAIVDYRTTRHTRKVPVAGAAAAVGAVAAGAAAAAAHWSGDRD
ncbi:HAD superfamily hydrolase (TIGR01490 family) [Catenulispora sp. GAS73]|uniref:HAD family hydrolase n=1 Tax=Catenulispora sp. GAS73 TaxID=3156269 RepID=UPI003513FD4C